MKAKTRAGFAPLALLCFVVGGVIPRQAAYSHHHAGGEMPHSHGPVLLVAHEHSDEASSERDHAGHHHDGVPLLSAPATRDHVHTQEPFHRVAMDPVVFSPALASAPAAAESAPRTPPAAAPVAQRSRGPPPSEFC